MVPSVNRLISPPWVLISFVVRHLMPIWLRLIIANSSFQSTHLVTSLASSGASSLPRDLFVHNNLLTILVYLDDRITPTQIRFNMSQMVQNFRPVWITFS